MRYTPANKFRFARTLTLAATVICCISWLARTPAHAQQALPEVADALKDARRTQKDMRVTIDKETGLPSRLRNINVPTNLLNTLSASRRDGEPTEDDVRRAVEAFFSRSQLSQAFPQRNSAARRVIPEVKPDPDLPGQYIASVKQEVNGIPVFGSSGKVSVNRALNVTSLSASFSALEKIDLSENISENQAIYKARAVLQQQLSSQKRNFGLSTGNPLEAIEKATPEASKIIFDPKLLKRGKIRGGDTRLAWQVKIDSYYVFIDAKEGKTLYSYRDHRSFIVRRVFDFATKSAVPQKDVINEETGTLVAPLSKDAIEAYQNSGAVRDFFFAMFGRKSYDNGNPKLDNFGSPVISYVRFGHASGAHWCPGAGYDCPAAHVSVYGPGYAGAIDVMGHEFMHGVIEHEANLKYADEAGAVNESLADIFGSLIELNTRGSGGNWLLGETLPSRSAAQPLRNMAKPELADASGQSLFIASASYDDTNNRGQPSHYGDYVYATDPICKTTSDFSNGCVHFNSGILNKFAYLVSEGGDHHSVSVKGIGHTKLGQLAYRTVRTKLTALSGLRDATNGFIDACFDFVASGQGGFTNDNCREVEKAQAAVGLNSPTG